MDKGIFITASYFPSNADNIIKETSKKIILIDGPKLAQLMIKYNVGVSIETTHEIKKIDSDFFIED